MPKFHVIFNVTTELTYEIEAADRESAIKAARQDGFLMNESEEDCELEHIEQK